MKTLTKYLTENSQESLQEYLINEGLFGWLKKLWNWLFNDAKDNVEKNDGEYINSEISRSFFTNDKEKKKFKSFVDFESALKKDNSKYMFVEYDAKTFTQLMKDTNSTKHTGTFFEANVYHNKNPKQTIFAVIIQGKKHSDILGFAFIVKGPAKNELTIVNTKWSNQLDIKDDVEKELLSKLADYIRSVKEYRAFKKITLDFDYDPAKDNKENNKKKDEKKKDKKKEETNKDGEENKEDNKSDNEESKKDDEDNKEENKEDDSKSDKEDKKDDSEDNEENKEDDSKSDKEDIEKVKQKFEPSEPTEKPETKLDKDNPKRYVEPKIKDEDSFGDELEMLIDAERREKEDYTTKLLHAKKKHHRKLDTCKGSLDRIAANFDYENEKERLFDDHLNKIENLFSNNMEKLNSEDHEFATEMESYSEKITKLKDKFLEDVKKANEEFESTRNATKDPDEMMKLAKANTKKRSDIKQEYQNSLQDLLDERNEKIKNKMKELSNNHKEESNEETKE